MNYPPFEQALTLFYARAPSGARPQRIKVGALELEKFTAWFDQLPGERYPALDDTASAAYDGIPIDCASAESDPPVVE